MFLISFSNALASFRNFLARCCNNSWYEWMKFHDWWNLTKINYYLWKFVPKSLLRVDFPAQNRIRSAQKSPAGRSSVQSEIYVIGTEVQFSIVLQTKIIKSFYGSIIPEGSESSRRYLALYGIRTWFKALWDVFFEHLHATLDSQLNKDFAQKAPAGRLSGNKYDF